MNLGSASIVVSSLPLSWIVIALFAVTIAVISLRFGTYIASAWALSLPLSLAAANLLPGTFLIGPIVSHAATSLLQAAVFGVILIISLICVFRIIESDLRGASPVLSVLVGVSSAILGVVFYLQVPLLQGLWPLGPELVLLFGALYRLWWLLGCYLVLVFARL